MNKLEESLKKTVFIFCQAKGKLPLVRPSYTAVNNNNNIIHGGVEGCLHHRLHLAPAQLVSEPEHHELDRNVEPVCALRPVGEHPPTPSSREHAPNSTLTARPAWPKLEMSAGISSTATPDTASETISARNTTGIA